MHFIHHFDILLDLADRGGHLAHPLGGQFFLLDRGLQVGHDGVQDVGEVHRGRALGHTQNKEVGPRISHQGNLRIITEKGKIKTRQIKVWLRFFSTSSQR